jgi:hypothetical protein
MRHTSIIAFRKFQASGMAKTRRGEAYVMLYHRGPLTGSELAYYCRVPGMWKRLSELKTMGIAIEVGTRVCTRTRAVVYEWDVTAHVPPSWDYVRPKARVFYGVKKNGKAGTFFVDRVKAEAKHALQPGSELFELKEVL